MADGSVGTGGGAEGPPDPRTVLHEALAAEREQRWADSFRLCRQALADGRHQPDAFNLFGRLCWAAGDAANAIAAQRYALLLAPEHPRAATDLQVALGAVRSSADAAAAFRGAVALHPDATVHTRDPLSLEPFVGMDRVAYELDGVLALDPSFAPAHAALGNIRARQGRGAEAVNAYRLAAMLDWNWPEAHLALAGFFDAVRDEENASRHRHEALSRKRVYPASAPDAHRRILVLTAPGEPTVNAPLDFCVNHARTALHRYYLVDDAPPPALPPYDCVFNAMEEAESSAAAIARCGAFIAAQSQPAINDPAHLARVRRSELPRTLRGVAGCNVAPAQRIARDDLESTTHAGGARAWDFPVVVRPVDTHRGDGQERIPDAAGLREYLDRFPGTHFDLARFVDYRSADGYYRKYRVFIVDGRAYPYHLAIAEHWKVHYHSSLMEQHAWMRDEEERFLKEPHSVFGAWDRVFGDIAARVGLEYFGVDCARNDDGSVLVFECGPGMLAQCRDAPALFAYKYAYVPRIFAALDDLLERVARENSTSERLPASRLPP